MRSFLEEKDALALLEDEETALAIDVVSNAVGYGQLPPSRAALEAWNMHACTHARTERGGGQERERERESARARERERVSE